MKQPAPKLVPKPAWKPTRPLIEREPDPLFIQALERYFDALETMTPIEACEVFKPVNEFLYDWIRTYGTHPKNLVRPTQADHARALRAQKVGL